MQQRTCFIAQDIAESMADQYMREETQAYMHPVNSPLFNQGMSACRVIQALASQWGIADRVQYAIQDIRTRSYMGTPYPTRTYTRP